jgi:hypothetical protein
MASPSKGSPPKSPVRAMRKKNAFSPNNPYKKKSSSERSGNTIKVMATLGDEEIIFIHKGNDEEVDAYMLNIKSDIDDNCPYIVDLCLAACLPRRQSKENHIVALSRGKSFWVVIEQCNDIMWTIW